MSYLTVAFPSRAYASLARDVLAIDGVPVRGMRRRRTEVGRVVIEYDVPFEDLVRAIAIVQGAAGVLIHSERVAYPAAVRP